MLCARVDVDVATGVGKIMLTTRLGNGSPTIDRTGLGRSLFHLS